jgi:hypothetical protein
LREAPSVTSLVVNVLARRTQRSSADEMIE